MIDTMLGKYRILQRLGEGGMGTVYKARDELIDRIVAIKVLRPELSRNPQLLERFRAEATALARLNHPRIAILHGLEQNGEELYMVMEFLPGETVEKMIKRMGRVPWVRAVEIASEVLAALDHAHDMGVVHRDIKPANVMVSPSGGVKVMDFGIARITGRDRNTRVGHTVGTPVYMSPEQLRGEEVDGRADIYAVGGMLFEMVTGQVTFEADSDYDLMMKQLNEMPPVPGVLVPALPPSLDSAVARSLAKRKEDRFVSAAAMQAALLAIASSHHPTPAQAQPLFADPKATRIAGGDLQNQAYSASQPALNSFAPRVSNESMSSAAATRIAPASAASVPLVRDWRTWVAGISVLIALAIVFRPRGASDGDAQVAANGDRSVASDTTASGAASTDTARTSSALQSTGLTVASVPAAPSLPTNVPVPVTPVDSVTSASPTSSRDNAPPSSGSAGTTSTPRPGSSSTKRSPRVTPPPSRVSSSATSGAAPPASATTASEPPKSDPPTRTNRDDVLSRDGASRAIASFLALFRAKDASALQAVMSGVSASMLTAVGEGRVSAASPDDITIGDGGNVSFATTLTWRTPFGGNRKGALRVSATLVHAGGGWRVSLARILEAPDVK